MWWISVYANDVWQTFLDLASKWFTYILTEIILVLQHEGQSLIKLIKGEGPFT